MKRYEAIERIVNTLKGDEIVISSTGMISRELYSIKDTPNHFYTLGSMGLPSSIGLGLAIAQANKKIIVIDGDGGTLMALGTIATIGNVAPKNLIHIVLDNEIHESTGGQNTVSKTIELENVAKVAGYRKTKKVVSKKELNLIMNDCLGSIGPSFILVKVERGRKDVPRVGIKPVEIKNRVMNFLESHN